MKCVMIIDQDLPVGLIANTAAVLALTIGHRIDGIIGEDVTDAGNSRPCRELLGNAGLCPALPTAAQGGYRPDPVDT